MRAHIASIALPLLLAGCTFAGVTRMAHPQGGAVAANHVVVENTGGDEELLDLPNGSLSSDAMLLSMTAEQTCFDVMLRTWRGALDSFTVALEVDGQVVAEAPHQFEECGKRHSCQERRSALPPLPTDGSRRIRRFDARICFEKVPVGRREVALILKQGAASFDFRWGFFDAPRTTPQAAITRRDDL